MVSSSGSCTERSRRDTHQHAFLTHIYCSYRQTVSWSNSSPNTKGNSKYYNKWCSVVINNNMDVQSDWLQWRQNRCQWRQQPPASWSSAQLKNLYHPAFLCHSLCYDKITSDQPFTRRAFTYACLPHQPITLCCLTPPSLPCLVPDLLKSVPVSWARMRKERDWVVPVRGCQSSVSWISLFLLRSLGIKQGRFSTLRPCLHTHPAAHGRRRLTQPHLGTTHSHQPS